jgi:hypothetical protein
LSSFLDEEVSRVSKQAKDKIIRDYMMKSYYWAVGSFMFLIGFLLGTIAKLVG